MIIKTDHCNRFWVAKRLKLLMCVCVCLCGYSNTGTKVLDIIRNHFTSVRQNGLHL